MIQMETILKIIKHLKLELQNQKNSKLPPKLITAYDELVGLINFFDKNLNEISKHQSR